MISFDFFDTLFTRKVARPIAIFTLVAHELEKLNHSMLSHEFVINFRDIRVCAEETARKKSSHEDVTFEEIYQIIKEDYHLDDEVTRLIQKVELEVEKKNLIPVKKHLDKVLEHLESKQAVYVLSDMYLPASFLSEVLCAHNDTFKSISVFVSNELGKTKSTGSLYKEVFKLVPEKRLKQHTGDNLTSDFFVPRSLGVGGVWAQEALLDKNELTLVEDVDLIFIDQVVGKWRELRITDYDSKAYLGFKYITSIFFGFVYETLLTLESRSVEKLFFLARDGQILKSIADIIIKQLGLKIRSEYVYISRRALLLPALFETNDEYWAKIFLKTPGVTFATILSRLQVTLEEYISIGGQKPSDVDKILSKEEMDHLERSLRTWKSLKELILGKASQAREHAYAYFEKLGFLEGETVHICDVGWSGSIQDGLYRLFSKRKPQFKLEGWYWGVRKNTKYSSRSNVKNSYMYYSDHLRPITDIEVFIEMLAQADHGQTLKYGPEGFVLAKVNELTSKWELPKMHKGVEDGASYLLSIMDRKDSFYEFKRLALGVIQEFKTPSKYFANILGSIPYSVEEDDSNIKEIAPHITLTKLLQIYFSKNSIFLNYSRWMEGSIVRSFGEVTASLLLNVLSMRKVLMDLRADMKFIIKKEIKLRYKHIKLIFLHK
jgi:predicted HAD superfamily hydrolase